MGGGWIQSRDTSPIRASISSSARPAQSLFMLQGWSWAHKTGPKRWGRCSRQLFGPPAGGVGTQTEKGRPGAGGGEQGERRPGCWGSSTASPAPAPPPWMWGGCKARESRDPDSWTLPASTQETAHGPAALAPLCPEVRAFYGVSVFCPAGPQPWCLARDSSEAWRGGAAGRGRPASAGSLCPPRLGTWEEGGPDKPAPVVAWRAGPPSTAEARAVSTMGCRLARPGDRTPSCLSQGVDPASPPF